MKKNKPIKPVVSFEEDNFDLDAYKRKTSAKIKEKGRMKRMVTKIKYGKLVIAILALGFAVFIYYIASVLLGML